MKYRSIKLTKGECKGLVISMLRRPLPGFLEIDKFWQRRRCPAVNMPKRSQFYQSRLGESCLFCNTVLLEKGSWVNFSCPSYSEFYDVLISLLQDNKFQLPGVPEDYLWYEKPDPFDMDGD